MGTVSAGIAETNERVETLAQVVETQARATAETREESGKLQQAQQALQKRLDVQADAIRLVHSDAEERTDRVKEFRAALEKAREVFASLPSGRPLPEGL
jgi:methyl-accepting chemotaxis protein